ncbi:MAG: ribulose-phosphate 3-epimerase [Sedimentisphaeraceae bacterium JB056]
MKLPSTPSIEIAPSVLSSDFARLADEVKEIENYGVKIVHLDVMDAHFVPNLTFGAPVIANLRKHSPLCFDTHLMITDAEKYLDDFIKAGSDHITFHIEAVNDAKGLINRIHDAGVTAGVSIKPGTSVDAIADIGAMCDMILVMTVEPGFGGQSFMHDAAQKCKEIRQIVGPDVRIQVDGGIDPTTAPIVTALGADTLVAGSAVFSKPDREKAIKDILAAANNI